MAAAKNPDHLAFNVDDDHSSPPPPFDDDGRIKRTGTFMTASAHIITAVIGSGVLSLAWATAQLGWVFGPAVMLLFALVTFFTSTLLSSCYRTGDVVTGKRNYTYMDAVRSYLGGWKVKFCGIVQYVNLFGTAIGYTIASALSMVAVQKSNCLKSHGEDSCKISSNPYMIAFGVSQIILSQIPDFDQLWWLSYVASVMSFTYSSIGLALGISKVSANGWEIRGSLTGVPIGTITQTQKLWNTFQSLGNIAFSYSFAMVLIEIQDTIKSPPSESKTMKKATVISVIVTTIFYMMCGCFGYAAFGDMAPGNLLTGFGHFNPSWLLDIANIAIIVHLVGAYQVFVQPLYAFLESQATKAFPDSTFLTRTILIPMPGTKSYKFSPFKLVWRTTFVIITTLISMIMPFFSNVVGLLGALGFWPLTVFFPIEMFIVQMKIKRWSIRWVSLQVMSISCLTISLLAASGSIYSIVNALKVFKPFTATF